MDLNVDFFIRKMIPADVIEIKQLEIACNLSGWSEKDYLEEVTRENSLSIAAVAKNGRILGFCIARLIMSGIEIYNFAVSPEARRKKIGKTLIRELLRSGREFGVEYISLEVRSSNYQAIEFYQASGFKQVGIRKNFYQNPVEDALLMDLRVSAEKKSA